MKVKFSLVGAMFSTVRVLDLTKTNLISSYISHGPYESSALIGTILLELFRHYPRNDFFSQLMKQFDQAVDEHTSLVRAEQIRRMDNTFEYKISLVLKIEEFYISDALNPVQVSSGGEGGSPANNPDLVLIAEKYLTAGNSGATSVDFLRNEMARFEIKYAVNASGWDYDNDAIETLMHLLYHKVQTNIFTKILAQ